MFVSSEISNRQFDIAIARLLGLEVLGEAPCYRSPETEEWSVSHDGDDTMQPVYLNYCYCDNPLDEVKYLGHVASCLRVVPFYHKHDRLARQALEQICDERKIEIKIWHPPGYDWVVDLRVETTKEEMGYASDKSLRLAICKALVELGKGNE